MITTTLILSIAAYLALATIEGIEAWRARRDGERCACKAIGAVLHGVLAALKALLH